MSKGRFITFEGGEGSGKSTQIHKLADRLRDEGMDVLTTREPGGSEGAESIRKLLVEGDPSRWVPMSEMLLLLAGRLDHVERTIRPALANGTWVLSDRFSDSSRAYQGIAGGVGDAIVQQLHQMVMPGFKPDMTLILDLPVEVGLARAGARNQDTGKEGVAEDRFERKGTDFHEALRAAYWHIAREDPKRCALINADCEIEALSDLVWQKVSDRLKVG